MKTFQLTFLVLFVLSICFILDTKVHKNRYFYPKKGVIINKYVFKQTTEGNAFYLVGRTPFMRKTVNTCISYNFVIKYIDEIETLDVGETSYNTYDIGCIYTKYLEKNNYVKFSRDMSIIIIICFILYFIYLFSKKHLI